MVNDGSSRSRRGASFLGCQHDVQVGPCVPRAVQRFPQRRTPSKVLRATGSGQERSSNTVPIPISIRTVGLAGSEAGRSIFSLLLVHKTSGSDSEGAVEVATSQYRPWAGRSPTEIQAEARRSGWSVRSFLQVSGTTKFWARGKAVSPSCFAEARGNDAKKAVLCQGSLNLEDREVLL